MMKIRRQLVFVLFSGFLTLAGCGGGGVSSNLLSGNSAAPAAAISTESTCGTATVGQAACTAILRTDVGLSTLAFMSQSADLQTMSTRLPSGYGPTQLRAAYNVPSGGVGQTVAVVDAYDDPKAEADMATYRAEFGLPVCSTANGCFSKIAEDGSKNYPQASAAWSGETSLDLDTVSAICPSCHILLVEASSAYLNDLALAVNRAVTLHATVVSNSYGGPEFSSETSLDSYYNHAGVPMVAASGDSAYGVNYPASSKYVIAVGGTQLAPSSTSRGYTETVWNDTASGCSAYETKPTWQHDTGCKKRTVNDIAFDASVYTPIAVYQSYCGGSVCGWVEYGGTSVGAPAISAMIAVAGNAAHMTDAESIYTASSKSLNDVVLGSNGHCSPSYLCNAGVGYDGPSGNGSPMGIAAL